MLSLKRKVGEKIIVTASNGERIEIWPTVIEGNAVRLTVDAPQSVKIDREEVDRRRNADLFKGQQGDSASKL